MKKSIHVSVESWMKAVILSSFLVCCVIGGCGDGGSSGEDAGDVPDNEEAGCTSEAECNDGVNCTRDSCQAGECRHLPDSSRCAADEYCDRNSGCVVAPPCADDSDCNNIDACLVGSCTPSSRTCRFDVLDGDEDGDPPQVCGGTDCNDDEPSISGVAVEQCNGIDDNCNSSRDEAFACVLGSTEACELCGQTGARSCNGQCAWDPCVIDVPDGPECAPGDERACTTSCMVETVETCDDSCHWPGCQLSEECNGLDDDCNGSIDEGFECILSVEEACSTSCGTEGTRTCLAGCMWGACTGPQEICNGADDDCNGECDNGFECCQSAIENCTTTEGSEGARVCSDTCGWGDCALITWARFYSGVQRYLFSGLSQSSDGGYIVGAMLLIDMDTLDFYPWSMRLDEYGVIEWQNTYGVYGEAGSTASVKPTSDGGYIMSARAWLEHDLDIIKIDAAGVVEWRWGFSGEPPSESSMDIIEDPDGSFTAVGSTEGGPSTDIVILHFDESGSIAWQRIFSGSRMEDVRSVQSTAGFGHVIGGSTELSAAVFDYWIISLDAVGNVLWQKTYGGSSDDWLIAVEPTSDGGYIAAGGTNSYGAGSYDIWVLKLDAAGDPIWQKTFGGTQYDFARSVQQTSDGGYIVGGDTDSVGPPGTNYFLLKLSEDGAVEWQRAYGGNGDETGGMVHQTADGGYIVGGTTDSSFGADRDSIVVLKTDSLGRIGGFCLFTLIWDVAFDILDTTAMAVDAAVPVSTSSFTGTSSSLSPTATGVSPTDICTM